MNLRIAAIAWIASSLSSCNGEEQLWRHELAESERWVWNNYQEHRHELKDSGKSAGDAKRGVPENRPGFLPVEEFRILESPNRQVRFQFISSLFELRWEESSNSHRQSPKSRPLTHLFRCDLNLSLRATLKATLASLVVIVSMALLSATK
jgi:hypothetical protein